MRNSSVIGRVAAIAAVVVAIIAVAIIVLSGGNSYQVYAIFQNAGQIVAGDQVEVAGNAIGSVSSVNLTSDGRAQLDLSINSSYFQPLHEGTQATIRLASLSGIANRYVDLRIGPANAAKIPNGGTIPTTATTTAVDLDQLFNTLDAPTRQGLQEVFQGSATSVRGQGQNMQQALQYLNPAVSSSSALFAEINRDTRSFANFLSRSGKLVTDLATRSGALSALITNLNTTTQALASRSTALGSSIRQLPPFMALADTTFHNLRTALDVITPLVNATKPVAPKLRNFLQQLRPLAVQAVPTVRDLALTISKPGANNDLIDLTALQPALAHVAMGPVNAHGTTRPGAFPQSATALKDFVPELATARPYSVDLTGWFEGFSHPGLNDANGAASRIAAIFMSGTLTPSASNILTQVVPTLPLGQQAQAVLGQLQTNGGNITTGYGDRCPGSSERGARWYPPPPPGQRSFPCNPSEQPTGP